MGYRDPQAPEVTDARTAAGLSTWSDKTRARVYAWLTPQEAARADAQLGIPADLPNAYYMAVAAGIVQSTSAGQATVENRNALLLGSRQDAAGHYIQLTPVIFAQSIVDAPDLTAICVSVLMANTSRAYPPDVTIDALYSALLPSPTGEIGTPFAFPAGLLTQAQAAPYLAALRVYFPAAVNQFNAAAADVDGPRATADSIALGFAQQNALAAGKIIVGATGVPVASALVSEGPTTLPDGNVYCVVENVTLLPGERTCFLWQGANWKPEKVSNPSANPLAVTSQNYESQPENISGRNPWRLIHSIGDLVQEPDRGTGSWYLCGALGVADLDGSSLCYPPAGWGSHFPISLVVHQMLGMVPREQWAPTRDALGAIIPATFVDIGAQGTFLPIPNAGDTAQPAPNYSAAPWTPPAAPGGQWTPPGANAITQPYVGVPAVISAPLPSTTATGAAPASGTTFSIGAVLAIVVVVVLVVWGFSRRAR